MEKHNSNDVYEFTGFFLVVRTEGRQAGNQSRRDDIFVVRTFGKTI